ncbi:hypothetical protein AgCh_038620 [Apium graveolens]
MDAVLARFWEEYLTILGSNAKYLTPQEVYDAVNEVYKAQLKAFHLFDKIIKNLRESFIALHAVVQQQITNTNDIRIKLDQLHQASCEARNSQCTTPACQQDSGEIEVRIQQSKKAGKSKETGKLTSTHIGQSILQAQISKDVGKDRLLKAAEGPGQDQEFNELLTVLRMFHHNNYIIYKRALANNINFIRVVIVKVDNFLEKRIVANVNNCGLDRFLQSKKNKKIEDEEMIRFLERYLQNADTMLPNSKFNLKDDKDDDEQKHDEQNPSGSNPSHSSKTTGSKVEERKQDEKKRND